jgi:hypothetical protein
MVGIVENLRAIVWDVDFYCVLIEFLVDFGLK